jgi:hypothetical protein
MATICRKPVFRELEAKIDGRRLIVGIHPNGFITVRLKGTSRTAEAPASWIYKNRLGIAAHLARQARRRLRKEQREAAIAGQAAMSLEALEEPQS